MGKQKLNIPMCAALVLLMLTMISIHLTSGLYARYTSTATATDSARVAKFDVEGKVEQKKDGEGKPIEGQFVLTVTNKSEVAVEYSAVISFDAPLSVTADSKSGTVSGDGKTVTFTGLGQLEPNAATPAEHTLQFQITNWVGVTSPTKKYVDTETVSFNFDVTITAEQID